MWRSKKAQKKSSKQKQLLKHPKSFIERINSEQGQKHRVIVTHLLSMTLTREIETELLWFVAQGFDLPLVIGEQFICKTRKFQSASYHACLEFTLTTLFHEDFAQEIWLMLLSKLHEIEICQLALNGLERKTRKFHLKTYENCFVGRECIDWLLNYKFVRTRERGIALGELWEERTLIGHVSKGHTFKDDQLYYRFNEEQIIKHIKLVQQTRNQSKISKSNRYNSSNANINIHSMDDMNQNMNTMDNSNSPMIRNKSNSQMHNNINYKKVNHKKKRSKKQNSNRNNQRNLRKQKSKSKESNMNQNKESNAKDMASKDNIFYTTNSNTNQNNNNTYVYSGSANTLIDAMEDSKNYIYGNIGKEWSDSEKEQNDILSDSDRLNSPNHKHQFI